MPKLGDVILNTVEEESPEGSVKTTDKATENGYSITDHIQREPKKMSLSGVIVGADAKSRIEKLEKYMQEGKRLTYSGRFRLNDMLIVSVNPSVDKDISNGYKYTLDLKQALVVSRKTYKSKTQQPTTSKGRQQPVKKNNGKRTHKVVRGDTLWDIAQKYYGSKKGSLYTLIYNANKDKIDDPHWIYPGQVFVIP